MTCRCPRVDVGDGEPRIEWPDPACSQHGYPRDVWRANDPLQKHARFIEKDTGEVLTRDEARARVVNREELPSGIVVIDGVEWMWRFRQERPSETFARLMAEVAA